MTESGHFHLMARSLLTLAVLACVSLPAQCGLSSRIFFPGETAVLGPTTETAWRAEDDRGILCGTGRVEKGVLAVPHETLGGRFGAFRVSHGTNSVWLAFLPSRQVKPCPWAGTTAHGGTKDAAADRRLVELLAAAGFGVLRDSPFWKMCERDKGVYRVPPEYDTFVDDLCAHGIRLNLGMKYENGIYENPVDPKAFAAWCEWTAAHFLGRVDLFEIWNEPANFVFPKTYGTEGTPPAWCAKYVDFTHGASDAIRRANPRATVAVAAEDIERRLIPLIELGIARSHEAIAFHPYCHTQHRPERTWFLSDGGQRLRSLAQQNGGCNRWVVTESGWTTYSGTGVYWKVAGSYPRASYAGQAECLVRMFLTSVASGIDYVIAYNFVNSGPRREYTEHNFGVVHEDFSPKPSYAAIAAMTRILEDAVYKGRLSSDPERYRVERFSRKDRTVLACWSVEGECTWCVPTSVGTVTACLDLYGNPLPVAADGCYTLTERPFYLVVKPAEQHVGKWIWAPGNAAPAFEKTFAVGSDVSEARLRICGLGFQESWLNGTRVGQDVLEPAQSVYDRHVFYRTYPLATHSGTNVLQVLLGHGWFNVRTTSAWEDQKANWFGEPRLWAEIELRHSDGTTTVVPTDTTWRQVPSPVAYDDMREGEIVDPGFILPRPGQKSFAELAPPPGGILAEADFPPARVRREIRPVKCWQPKSGDGWILDFGENLAGWMRLKLRGLKRGDIVKIRYDERVAPDGEPCVWVKRVRGRKWPANARVIDAFVYDLGSANVLPGGEFQMDRYVATGADEETYEPRFTYNGFRYVWVRGLKSPPADRDAVARFIHTDFADNASFASSSPELDNLIRVVGRSYKGNFTDGVPTDCPHREKNGWLGDAGAVCETAQYLYENTAAYRKWIRDIADQQRPPGNIPRMVPTPNWGIEGAELDPLWTCTFVSVPATLLAYRNDLRTFAENYAAMRRFTDQQFAWMQDGLIADRGLADHAFATKETPRALTSTAYVYQNCRLMERFARRLGKADDAAFYHVKAEAIRKAFNKAFYKGNGVYGNGSQLSAALPLRLGLVPEGERAAVGRELVEAVHRADDHIEFGLCGTKHVFRALSECGRTDLALKMILQPTAPSYQAMVKVGATTLWEDWYAKESLNHVMFGDFVSWVYQYLAGIRLPESADACGVPDPEIGGFATFLLAPVPVDGLDRVTARVGTPHGEIRSSWERKGPTVDYAFEVPPGCSAEIRLPGREPRTVGAGRHVFQVEVK